jgi:predicted DNA-binding transcriptional regulator YafY
VLAGLALLESSPYQGAARRARAKISSIMSDEQRAPVQAMLGRMRVVDAVAPLDGAVPIGMLSDALASHRVVRIAYLGAEGDGSGTTHRDVEAMELLRAGDSWLLAGWCRLRDAIRGFHLERIARLEILDEVFTPRDAALLEADLARWPTRRLG